MGERMEAQEVGDYDVRGRDLRQYYAGFGRLPLSDSAIWSLSLADSTLPDNHIGSAAWLAYIAEADCGLLELQDWAIGLGRCLATMKPLLNKRHRLIVEDWREDWGAQASLDGMTLAVMPAHKHAAVPSLRSRAEEFGIGRRPYQRIRNLVHGAVIMQMAQFEDALCWAVRIQRH